MNKYCRICWNTSNWRQPSGDVWRLKLELGKSYVAEHGFGHEEWLFNPEWLLSGYDPDDQHHYRYGFLQPIGGKNRNAYIGKTFSILLYTVNPARTPMIVAKIGNAYVPNDRELSWVFSRTEENGWLDSMRRQVIELAFSDQSLLHPEPSEISNIRFLLEDVRFYDPMIVVPNDHKIRSIHRYQALDWNDDFEPMPSIPVAAPPPRQTEDRIEEWSELERTRSSQLGTTYSPQHVRLQKRLFRALQESYGTNSVRYEEGFVDLTLTEPSGNTFIEIKISPTVKSCIRSAFGQLMEYGHFPNVKKADVFVVVGDVFPTPEDRLYLHYIRDTYRIPLYYAQWSWAESKLGERI